MDRLHRLPAHGYSDPVPSSGSVNDTDTPPPSPPADDYDHRPQASWPAKVLRPAPIIALSTALSFAAWSLANLLETEDAIGFTATPSLGTLMYLGWIVAAIACAHLGYTIVRTAPTRSTPDTAVDPVVPSVKVLHTALLLTAAFGIAYVWWLWTRDGLDVLGLIADNQANLLRAAIPLSPGPATLRYAAIPAGALAIRNLFVFRLRSHPSRLRSVDLLSLVALMVVAVPASRLSLLMALITAATLLWYIDRYVPTGRQLLVVGVVTAVTLSALNVSRNGGWYRVRGITNPAEMQLYQSASYVGAPVEGGSAAGRALLGYTDTVPPWAFGRVLEPFVPTFFTDAGSGRTAISIHDISTIEPNLTTNSVFAELTLRFGIVPMVASLLAIFALAAVVGALLRAPTLATVLAAGPLLYGFAEVWRLYLFNDGLLIFCVAWPLLLHALIRLWENHGPPSARRDVDAQTPPLPTSV
jgi:hypothetical protein